ncbi:hypothetical protein EUGRSUZ_L03135 [Eucalyptus grandis]|uniref:Cytochrome c oxidase assembly factor 6 n=2 Tax=Eucalyptus TaxID=3932 RepID=A0AAD9WHA2_EUCGR|nr:hypothetical protein EUGRSUZ_L03135 [Eucalyptus grandis]
MAAVAETYGARDPETVHADVLSKARESCYKARDAFYACVEKESSKKPTEIGSVGLLYPAECKKSRAEYENRCRASWVKHFDRQYCRNKTLKRLLDDKDAKRGPSTFPQPSTFKTPRSFIDSRNPNNQQEGMQKIFST